ncbi:sialate O-acetylesterase [Roseimaritima ulvae]|uniref:Sialate O-acetylesterase domain-containing protein n=1 Tax=Roseimaritima ulvae TaxID=980254 RepID=A0A5B9QK04_9BACT|nr:sialate O-acetylesterase [Roseimaritima ulvae]QEG39437.1 hypothetical protein UC8_14320 [Roseimaritima ulvae]
MIRFATYFRLAVFLLFPSSWAWADVRLPNILGSGMVLQRDSEVRIWGWADAGEPVAVRGDWNDAPVRTVTKPDGSWQVRLRTGPASGPHSIRITGHNQLTLDDVLFGEVWLASGQSNMEMPLCPVSGAYTGTQDYEVEIQAAEHPEIRLFQVGNFASKTPQEDVVAGISVYGVPIPEQQWNPCTAQSVANFSATAYYFARQLHVELNVPIGIIDASWGGTPAEAWTPLEGLRKIGDAEAIAAAEQQPDEPDLQQCPTRLYNGMIHPLRQMTLRGVIWYQGEGNIRRASRYRELFSTMITQWRKAFDAEISFYFTQISPFRYRDSTDASALLREAQLQTLTVSRTGMVVTMDIGDLGDIHPKNKQEVGRRLALWALTQDYGRQLAYSGPLFKAATFGNGRATLSFDHVGGGLKTRDGQPPSHFQLAGEDRIFHDATAVIVGDTVVVTSDEVAQPRAVRYGFTDTAEPNLTNDAGLPASSFRSDDW